MEHKIEKIEKPDKIHQLCVFDEVFDVTKECNSVSKLINDSWVKVDTNESLEVSLKSESVITELQKVLLYYVISNLYFFCIFLSIIIFFLFSG